MANTWNQVGTLMGPQGPKGATGAPSGAAVVGSVYIDASTGNLYTYEA